MEERERERGGEGLRKSMSVLHKERRGKNKSLFLYVLGSSRSHPRVRGRGGLSIDN